MKKYITFFVACFLLAGKMNAQEKKHEISLGTGVHFLYNFGYQITSPFIGPTSGSKYEYEPILSLFVQYKYSLNELWKLGGLFMYHGYSKLQKGTKNEEHTHVLTAMMETNRIYYIEKDSNLTLYGGLALGASNLIRKGTSAEKNKFNFAYNVTPIGLSVGKIIGLFAELSYGFKGILNGGIFYRF